MSGDLVERIVAVMAPHYGGWVDNGKPDEVHCRCGHRPGLGEFHGLHVAREIAELL